MAPGRSAFEILRRRGMIRLAFAIDRENRNGSFVAVAWLPISRRGGAAGRREAMGRDEWGAQRGGGTMVRLSLRADGV